MFHCYALMLSTFAIFSVLPRAFAQGSSETVYQKQVFAEVELLGASISRDHTYKSPMLANVVPNALEDVQDEIFHLIRSAQKLRWRVEFLVSGYDEVSFETRTTVNFLGFKSTSKHLVIGINAEVYRDLKNGEDLKTRLLRTLYWADAMLAHTYVTATVSVQTQTLGEPDAPALLAISSADRRAAALTFDKLIITDRNIVFNNPFFKKTSSICLDLRDVKSKTFEAFVNEGDLSAFKDGFGD